MKHLSLLALSFLPALAAAHDGHHSASFAQGLVHPLSGADHVLAMLAVGIWAGTQALTLRSAMLAPLGFVVFMWVGAILAAMAVPLALTEPMIAASLLILGLGVCSQWRIPAIGTSLLIAGFAIAHGFAHGIESGAQDVLSAAYFMLGMAVTTAALHGAGFMAAVGLRTLNTRSTPLRWAGAGIAAYGAYLLTV